MVINFPKLAKKAVKVQPTTTILVVDFKAKTLVGEVEIDNKTQEVMSQWGQKVKKPKVKKQSEVA